MQCPKLPKKATLMIAVISMALMALLHLFKLTRFQSYANAKFSSEENSRTSLVLYFFAKNLL